MQRLQRIAATILLHCAVLPAFAVSTSKVNRITLACPSNTVRVRIFDSKGTMLDDTVYTLEKGQRVFVYDDSRDAPAADRFVTTSSSKGCVKGNGDTDDKTAAPINTFRMPCNAPPIDLVLTASPKATFTVHRRIPDSDATPCRWNEADLSHGSAVAYFTSDETLVIEATSESGKKRGYLKLDWKKAHAGKPFPKPCFPGQNGGACSENAKAIALDHIAVEVRSPQ